MAMEALPLIETVFDSLKIIYPNFKPFQVCFSIGAMRTGGTTTSEFILIGTELTTTGEKSKIPQRIKAIIAHEAIHTQQKYLLKPGAVVCNQLDECLDEGVANFIGELITALPIMVIPILMVMHMKLNYGTNLNLLYVMLMQITGCIMAQHQLPDHPT
ncbi:MAG: hypothetical protein IPI65_16365 [Bacteroidetes bacterium]|nr:hypothetical protein [Bacteroidota bacterium]